MRQKKYKRSLQAEPNARIRKGDKVMVISGDHKGRSGVILAVKDNRAIVQGLNMRKRHVKKSEGNPNGEILSIEAPIYLSKLMVCVKDDLPKKLKLRVNTEGERELYYKHDGEEIAYRALNTNQSNKK